MLTHETVTEYFAGQGTLLIAKLQSNGMPGVYRPVANVPSLEVSFEVEKLKKKESMTGQKLVALSLTKEKNASFKAELESLSTDNLEMSVHGTQATTAAGGFTDVPLPSGLVAGDTVAIAHTNILTMTVKDSAGTPVNLTVGEDFEFNEYGSIKLLDVAGFTQPFKVSGTYGTSKSVAMFTGAEENYALRFEGLNTANGNKKVLVELYKISPEPLKQLALISDEPGSIALEGEVLAALDRTYDPLFGYFGRVIFLG